MIVTPFGDNQAHGTIGDTFTLQRRRGQVFAKVYKVPTDPKSAGQLSQRSDFATAITNWNNFSTSIKTFWHNKAVGKVMNGYNFYIQQFLLGLLPVGVPLMSTNITDMVINNLRATVASGFRIEALLTGHPFAGSVWDNSNTFVPGTLPLSSKNLILNAVNGAETAHYLEGDSVVVTHFGQPSPITIYLPDVTENIYLYCAVDGSTYYDFTLTDLAQPAP